MYLEFDNSMEPKVSNSDRDYEHSGYFVQPEDSALFEVPKTGQKKHATQSTFLEYKPVCLSAKPLLPAVPLVPFAGYQLGKKGQLSEKQKLLLQQSKRLCGKVMAAHRVNTLRANGKTIRAHNRKALSNAVSVGVTPQGWLAEVTTGPKNKFDSILICNSPTEVKIDCRHPEDFADAWLNKELFIVVKNVSELKFKRNETDELKLNLAGWNLGLNCEYIVIKSSNKSFEKLVDEPESWTQVNGLTCTANEVSKAQTYFRKVIADRLNSTDPEKISLYTDLKESIETPSWNGVLVFEPSIDPKEDGSGLGAINTLVNNKKLHEYFRKRFSALGFATSKVFVPEGKSDLEVKETSVFAVIDLAESEKAEPTKNSATFVLNNLSARFKNADLLQFKADGTLKLQNLFDRSIAGVGTEVQIKGRYKKVNGKGVYSFCTEGNLEIKFNEKQSLLKSVGVNAIEFKSVIGGESAFDFSGWLEFASDASNYFGNSKLSFEGIRLALLNETRNFLDLDFDPSELKFDLALSSLFESFLQIFPLKYKSFFYSANTRTMSSLGFLSTHSEAVKYGLVFELDMGTIGSLVSGDSVIVDLMFGWDSSLGVGIRFPSWSGGNAEIGIEGVIKLSIDTFSIGQINEQNQKKIFAILLKNCTMNLFGEDYGTTTVTVIVPDGGQKPAWLLTIEDKSNGEPHKYLAVGQRFKFPSLETASGTESKLIDFRKSIGSDPVKFLKSLPTESCSNSAPSYCPQRNWLAGGWLKLAGTVEVHALFVDDTIYGGALKVPFLKPLIGEGIDIAYTKISRAVGAFSVDLQILSALSKLGPFGVTVPRVGLSAYTNGGFRFDLGFPKDKDFSRSFQFSLGLLGGRGGFYYGFMHKGGIPSSISLGVGFNVYYGKGINIGVVSGRFEIGAFGIIETTFSIQKGVERFTGLVGIYGFIEGRVSLGFVSGRAKVLIEATGELSYVRGEGGYLRVGARLEGSFSITIGVGECATTYTYDFTVKFKYTWTFGKNGEALQARFARKLLDKRISGLAKEFKTGDVIPVPLYFAPSLGVRGEFHKDWNPQAAEIRGIGIAAVMVKKPDGDPKFNSDAAILRTQVVMRVAEWILNSISSTPDHLYSLSEIASMIAFFQENENNALPYKTLSTFLEKNFSFEMFQQVRYDSGKSYELVQFPFPPGLRAKIKKENSFEYAKPWIPRHVDASTLSVWNNDCRNQIYGNIDVIQPSINQITAHKSLIDYNELICVGYFSTMILQVLSTIHTHLSEAVTDSNTDPSQDLKTLVALFGTFDPSLPSSEEQQENSDSALTVAGRMLMSGKSLTVGGKQIGIYEMSGIETDVALPKDEHDKSKYKIEFEVIGKVPVWFSYPHDEKFEIQANYLPLNPTTLGEKELFPKRTFDPTSEVLSIKESKYYANCYLSAVKLRDRLPEVSKIAVFDETNHISNLFALPRRFAIQAIRSDIATSVEPIAGAKYAIWVPLKCLEERSDVGKLYRLPTIPEKIRRALDQYSLNNSHSQVLKVEIFAKSAKGLEKINGVWTLFNNNLSSVSNPPDASPNAIASSMPIYCAQNTESNNNFLNILRRLSVVNESGYFLSLESTSATKKLLDDEKIVELSIVFTSEDNLVIFPGANAVLISASQTKEGSEIVATNEIDYLPKAPAGALPIVCVRERPVQSNYLQNIYNLVGYEIVDVPGSSFKPEVFPMPIMAQNVEGDFQIPDAKEKQMFSALLPAAGKLRNPVFSKVLKKIAGENAELANVFDPYSIVGREITIGLKFRDIFGNTIKYDDSHPSTTFTIPLTYTDRIVELSEWPGLVCGYRFESDGTIEILFEVSLNFAHSLDEFGHSISQNKRSRDYLYEVIEKYQKILWQIQKREHDTAASMRMSIDFSMNDAAEPAADLEQKLERFLKEKILEPLNTALEDEEMNSLYAVLKHKFKAKKREVYSDSTEILDFTLSLEMNRPDDGKYTDKQLSKKIPEIASLSNLINPYTTAKKEGDKSILVLDDVTFAKAVQNFYGENSNGYTLSYRFNDIGEKIYTAIRNRFFSITHLQDNEKRISTNFFAQQPLSNHGFTGSVGSENLNNFDVDAELDYVISKYEEMISANSVQSLLKVSANSLEKVSQFIERKHLLSNALASRVIPIFNRSNSSAKLSSKLYKESLERDLRNSFQTDCVAQVQCQIGAPYDKNQLLQAGSPILYGRVIGSDGKNVDSAATKLNLAECENGVGQICFVSANSDGIKAQQRSFSLTGVYRITHLERSVTKRDLLRWAKLRLNGLEPRNLQNVQEGSHVLLPQDLTQWLYLIIPKEIELHEFTVPVVYRRVPPSPVIAGDFARTPEKSKVKQIKDAHIWSYEMLIESSSPILDKLRVSTSLQNTLNDGASQLNLNGLIAHLREFRAQWDNAANFDIDKVGKKLDEIAKALAPSSFKHTVADKEFIKTLQERRKVKETNTLTFRKFIEQKDYPISIRISDTTKQPEGDRIEIKKSTGCVEIDVPSLDFGERRKYRISYEELPITSVNRAGLKVSTTRNTDLIESTRENGCPVFESTADEFIMYSEDVLSGKMVEPSILVDQVIYVDDLAGAGKHTLSEHIEALFSEVFKKQNRFSVQISWYHGYEQQPIRERISSSDDDIEEYELSYRVPVLKSMVATVENQEQRGDLIEAISGEMKKAAPALSENQSLGFFQIDMTVFRNLDSTSELLRLPKLRIPFTSVKF